MALHVLPVHGKFQERSSTAVRWMPRS